MIFKENKHTISSIFVLFLLLIFVLTASLTIAFGAKVYSETASSMDSNFDTRTGIAYLTQKVHMNDSYDMIDVITILDVPVLCLYQEINDDLYVTYLYEYDGSLYEYFTRNDLDFDFEYGNEVVKMTNLNFQLLENNLLSISFVDDSNVNHKLLLTIHSGEVFYA